jgi:cob(I)alamin adenosyltransferase
VKITHGLTHVYTGDGKGKTTVSLGLALRAMGWGLKVMMVQFIKGYPNLGEIKFAEENSEQFTVKQFAIDPRRDIDAAKAIFRQRAVEEAMEYAESAVSSGAYDLVILDELNVALHYDLVPLERVLRMVKTKPREVELVITGRGAPEGLKEAVDYVTEMRMVKHPYEAGIQARPGVDY